MFLSPTTFQVVSGTVNQAAETQESQSYQEPHPQTNGRINVLQNGPFNQAIQSIASLFRSFQENISFEGKILDIVKIYQEIICLRNAALQDRRALLAANLHLDKKEFDDLELSEIRRGRAMEDYIDAVMQQVTLLVDTELKNQLSLYPQGERKQFLTFYQEAQKLFELTSPLDYFEREWDYAKCLYEEGLIGASIAIIKKLPLPENLRLVFDLTVGSPTKEKLESFFLVSEQAEIRNYLKNVSAKLYQPKTLSNVLSQRTVMEVFLKYADPVRVMQLNKSCHESVKKGLPSEYAKKHLKNAKDLRAFSLASVPVVCRDFISTAIVALYQNGLEYQFLDSRLKNDIGIAKVALLSIVQKGISSDFEKLISFFPDTFQIKLTDYISFIRKRPDKSFFDSRFENKNKDSSYLKFLAKTFICKFPEDKDICRIMVQIFGGLLKYTSASVQDDPEIVMFAIQNKGVAFKFASERLKDNEEIILAAAQQKRFFLFWASERLKNNEAIVLAAVTQNRYTLKYANERLKDNEAIIMAAITRYGGALLIYASERLKNNEAIVMAAVTRDGNALQHASERLKNNEEIVMEAVTRDGYALGYASKQLKEKETIVMAAVRQEGCALKYASEQLKNNEAIVMAALQQKGSSLFCASELLKDNEAIVMAAVTREGDALQSASVRLQNNEAIVMAAVTRFGSALQYAGERPQDNEAIVMAAVTQYGGSLQYASKRLQNNEAIVMAAAKQKGSSLSYASERLKENEEIVMAAVTQEGCALRCVSERLKDNEAIVMAAVTQNGYALRHSSEYWKDNEKIVIAAVARDVDALKYASERLKDKKETIMAAVTQGYDQKLCLK